MSEENESNSPDNNFDFIKEAAQKATTLETSEVHAIVYEGDVVSESFRVQLMQKVLKLTYDISNIESELASLRQALGSFTGTISEGEVGNNIKGLRERNYRPLLALPGSLNSEDQIFATYIIDSDEILTSSSHVSMLLIHSLHVMLSEGECVYDSSVVDENGEFHHEQFTQIPLMVGIRQIPNEPPAQETQEDKPLEVKLDRYTLKPDMGYENMPSFWCAKVVEGDTFESSGKLFDLHLNKYIHGKRSDDHELKSIYANDIELPLGDFLGYYIYRN